MTGLPVNESAINESALNESTVNEASLAAPESTAQAPTVVGARMIVEVLRHYSGTPPENVQLTPMRNKAAQFVLEKSLQKMEHAAALLSFPVPQMALASMLYQFARNEKKIIYMAQADWGAVKMIDAVFDAVIDQGRLDAEGVWLLNRFRLPLFHSVLSDYSFFFARQNLARRFVNAVTLHLLTTREPFARDLKFVLGGIATRMHEAFDQGAGKFNALCLEGQTWFATQQQRLQKAETRIREMAETRSRKQQAEERVVTLINRCIVQKPLPELLLEFITGDWRKLLLFTSMKEGEQGINWKRQSRLTESMVEFVQACQTPEGREQYQKFLPSLLKGLQTSLADIIDNAAQLAATMDTVELALTALAAGARPDTQVHAGLALPRPASPEFEVTLVSNPSLERIFALQAGQWVRFRTQDGQFEVCVLVLPGHGNEPWSFVNQSGQGVVSKTAPQLAGLLANGVLEIVGEGNAIDDVLNHVVAQVAANLPRPSVSPPPAMVVQSRGIAAEPVIGDAGESREHAGDMEPASSDPAVTPDLVLPCGDTVEADAEPTLAPPEPADPLATLDAVLSRQEDEVALANETFVEDYPAELMEASYAAVDGLQIGARLVWYKSEKEDVSLKLAVKMRSSDKFVFVNHVGLKTLDTHRHALACLIASGRIVIIDIGAKFDSALERIVKQIQQDKK